MQHIVLLPGAGALRVPWADALRKALGPGYEVIAPEMPDPDEPHYEAWKQRLVDVITPIEGDLILIGHSLGGSVILKYLAENEVRKRIAAVFSLAAPHFGGEVEEFHAPKDFSRLSRIPRIFLYHGREDDVVPSAHLLEYARKLPQATVRMLDHRGHSFADENPTILIDDIRSLST